MLALLVEFFEILLVISVKLVDGKKNKQMNNSIYKANSWLGFLWGGVVSTL